jgi:hypothetical protein
VWVFLKRRFSFLSGALLTKQKVVLKNLSSIDRVILMRGSSGQKRSCRLILAPEEEFSNKF